MVGRRAEIGCQPTELEKRGLRKKGLCKKADTVVELWREGATLPVLCVSYMAKSFRSLKALSLRLPSLPDMRSRMCANVSLRRFLQAQVSGAVTIPQICCSHKEDAPNHATFSGTGARAMHMRMTLSSLSVHSSAD